MRAGIAVLVVVFNELFYLSTGGPANRLIRDEALAVLLLNVLYYFAARGGAVPRAQAYARMLGDVGFITLGLYSAGGLAAASLVGVYTIVPVYAGLVLSSVACVLATAVSTVAYLAVVFVHPATAAAAALPGRMREWEVAAFNLLVLNVVGGLTAVLAEAYRRSRLALAAVHDELERAHDQSLLLNAELQRAGRLSALGEVVAGVAHELNNVLSVAVGHLTLLRSQGSSPELRARLDAVEQSVDSAVRIVHNTLDGARQPADTAAPLSIVDVARRVVALKRYELRREDVAVHMDFAPDLPLVRGVPLPLQQVLLNLVTNAQQALRGAPPPRAIEIVGHATRGRVVVEVRDTGPGIPVEHLPRLFEPFFTTKAGGTGLGLAISAGIAREAGGTLVADNRPGGGAVFRLELPALAPASLDAQA